MVRRASTPTVYREALITRLIYALLRPAVRLAVRHGLTLHRFVELARLTFFDEHRKRSPHDMAQVAQTIELSLRQTAELSRQHQQNFFVDEGHEALLRNVIAALNPNAKSESQLAKELELSASRVRKTLLTLTEQNFVSRKGKLYHLQPGIISLVDDDLKRRVDGLHHQLEIISAAVDQRFTEQSSPHVTVRAWDFVALPADADALAQKTLHDFRHGIVDVEDRATQSNAHVTYGATFVLTPLARASAPAASTRSLKTKGAKL